MRLAYPPQGGVVGGTEKYISRNYKGDRNTFYPSFPILFFFSLRFLDLLLFCLSILFQSIQFIRTKETATNTISQPGITQKPRKSNRITNIQTPNIINSFCYLLHKSTTIS